MKKKNYFLVRNFHIDAIINDQALSIVETGHFTNNV